MRIMKWLFIFFTCFIFIFTPETFSQQEINSYDKDGKKTGFWRVLYENGRIRYEGNFLNDHPVGEFKRYYPNSAIQAILEYSDDSKTAYARLFYDNGKIAAEGKYIGKDKDSVWSYYSSFDGKLSMKETYQEGKREGESIKLYNNMIVSERIIYSHDLRHGTWEQFYQNGKPRLMGNYVNDLREGEFMSWDANGYQSMKGYYQNGLMHGKWIYFNEKGGTEFMVEYNEGDMIPNEEMERRKDEFSKRVQESIGNYSEPKFPF